MIDTPSVDQAAIDAARSWAADQRQPMPDDRMLRAYGIALLTQLAGEVERDPNILLQAYADRLRHRAVDLIAAVTSTAECASCGDDIWAGERVYRSTRTGRPVCAGCHAQLPDEALIGASRAGA